MSLVAIVQARSSSTRLPGKVLADLQGQSVLAWTLRRLAQCRRIDRLVVATTVASSDDPVAAEAIACGLRLAEERSQCRVGVFRGAPVDVLARFHGAAIQERATHVLRVTADCPLVDPGLVEQVLERVDEGADYACVMTVGRRAFPRGFDAECFSFAALDAAFHQALRPEHRAHVTPWIYQQPQRYRLSPVEAEADYRHLRLTLDTAEDWQLLQTLLAHFSPQGHAACERLSWRALIDALLHNPQWRTLNSAVRHKTLAEC